MNPINCVTCGCLNGSRADVCERCGTLLPSAPGAASAAAHAAPFASSAAPVVAAGNLPIDFPFAPFQSVGDALSPTFRLYRDNFLLVGKIVLAATLPLMMAQYALTIPAEAGGVGAAMLLNLATICVNSLMEAALIYAVVTLHRTGASPSLRDAYAWGSWKWGKLFLCMLLANISIAIGFLLLVVPGIILSLMFAVATPVVVIENRRPVAALERSIALTKGNRVLILFTAGLLWLVVKVATWLTADYGAMMPGATGASFFTSFVYAGVGQMLASASTVLSLYLYLGIRADKGETVSTYDAVVVTGAAARN